MPTATLIPLDAFAQLIVESLGRGLEPHEAQSVRKDYERIVELGGFQDDPQKAADALAKHFGAAAPARVAPPTFEHFASALMPAFLRWLQAQTGAVSANERRAAAAEQCAAQGDAMLGLFERFVRAHESLAANVARVAQIVPKCTDEGDAKLLPFFALASASKPALPQDKRYEHRVGMLAQNLRDSFDYWTLSREAQAKVKAEAAAAKAAATTDGTSAAC